MTAGSATMNRWPELTRWGACFALALFFHAAGAAALLARWNEDSDLASAPVILVDLSPITAARDMTPNDLPPEPQQAEAEPEKPVEKIDPEPQTELHVTPPPKPKEEKPKQKQASLPTATSIAEHKAERAAAQNWKSLLVSKLERSKRYPPEARARGEQGVAQLAFSIDRNGSVHNVRIAQSSGSGVLDRETLLLIERAQPLPPPPAEIPGAQIAITVPIRYNIR